MANPTGLCAHCREEGPLSFEHIPPRAGGNDSTVVTRSVERWADTPIEERATWRGPQQQRGAGGHWLCTDCNNWLGLNLVEEYLEWTRPVMAHLGSSDGRALLERLDHVREPGRLEVQWLRRSRGALARYGLAACLTVAQGLAFQDTAPVLAAIRNLDGQRVEGLPRLYLRFYAGPTFRMGPPQHFLFKDGSAYKTCRAVEVAAAPFAFTLLLDGEVREAAGHDITEWLALPAAELRDAKLETDLGFGHTPIINDFRSAGAVEHEARRSPLPSPREMVHPLDDRGRYTSVQQLEVVSAAEVTLHLPGDWTFPNAPTSGSVDRAERGRV